MPGLRLPPDLPRPRRGIGGAGLALPGLRAPLRSGRKTERAAGADGPAPPCFFNFAAAGYLPFLGAFLSSFLAFFFIQWLLCDCGSHAGCVVRSARAGGAGHVLFSTI